MKRRCESWRDCTLPACERVRAHRGLQREPQGRLDLKQQVQQVLLRCRVQPAETTCRCGNVIVTHACVRVVSDACGHKVCRAPAFCYIYAY